LETPDGTGIRGRAFHKNPELLPRKSGNSLPLFMDRTAKRKAKEAVIKTWRKRHSSLTLKGILRTGHQNS
jgi:hypothetical protein